MPFFFTAIDCGNPPDVANGAYTLSDGTVLGSVATYSCNSGYTLARPAANSLTCRPSGNWGGTVPRCRGRYMY